MGFWKQGMGSVVDNSRGDNCVWEFVWWVQYFPEEMAEGCCAYASTYVLCKGLKQEFQKRGIPTHDGFWDVGHVVEYIWDNIYDRSANV